jgi:hypothetical protein
MADLCSLAEEGCLAPEDAAQEAATGVGPGSTHMKKGRSLKRRPLQVLATEPSAPTWVTQKNQTTEEATIIKSAAKRLSPYMNLMSMTPATTAPS